jgi:hypothetical protein
MIAVGQIVALFFLAPCKIVAFEKSVSSFG